MHRKICTNCERASHSADIEGSWICPYCGADLTNLPSLPPEDFEPGQDPTAT